MYGVASLSRLKSGNSSRTIEPFEDVEALDVFPLLLDPQWQTGFEFVLARIDILEQDRRMRLRH
jgi:hypothetical protein